MTYHNVINATFQGPLYIYLDDGLTGITSSRQGNETGTVVSGHLLGDSCWGGECSTLYEGKKCTNTLWLKISHRFECSFNSRKNRGMTNLRWRHRWCRIRRWFVWWWIHRSSAETHRSVPVWCPPLQEQPYTCTGTSTNVCQLLNVLILAKKSRIIH